MPYNVFVESKFMFSFIRLGVDYSCQLIANFHNVVIFVEVHFFLLRLTHRRTNIENEFKRMKENHQRNTSQQEKIQVKELLKGSVLKPLGISLGVMFFQQFTGNKRTYTVDYYKTVMTVLCVFATGINAMVFYTVSIFQSAGSTIDGRYATIIVGFVQFIFTVASGFLVLT